MKRAAFLVRTGLFWLALLAGRPVSGSPSGPFLLEAAQERYSLAATLEVFEDTSGQVTPEAILSGTYGRQFRPAGKKALNYGVTSSVVWLRFSLRNADPKAAPRWILVLNNGLIDEAVLFELNEGADPGIQVSGDRLRFSERPIPHHHLAFYLPMPDTTVRQYFMRLETSGSMQAHLRVFTEKSFQRANQQTELLHGLFIGAMLVMLCYNLFLFFSLKDVAYLAYSTFILSHVLLQTAYSGHLYQHMLGNFPAASNLSIPLLMALIPVTVIWFSLAFLDPANINRGLRRFMRILMVLAALLFVGAFRLPIRIGTSLAGMLIIVSLVAVIIAGVNSWTRGNKAARFYLLAWILLIIAGFVTAFRNFGFLEPNFLTIHGVRIAAVVEVLLLAMSLADKYNIFRKEKEETQLQMLRMQEEANRVLEEKVKARTRQLALTNDQLSDTLEKVEVEREKSDRLLLNVLPGKIAEELKQNGEVLPRRYEPATVLFTDFKGFTALAEKMDPQEVLTILNECFLAFDEICNQEGMEKIKTIGDSYMAVGGLPVPNTSNPVDAVRTALKMRAWVNNWNRRRTHGQPWQIRIGIHTGPVVAGVIGKNKFVYDIWGDTVNTASRMESTGQVGKINISQATYDQVKDRFVCAYQGKVKAKNKGEIDVYWVEEERG